MNTSKSRIQTALTIVFAGAALIFTAVMGLWVFVSATATPIHPAAHDVSSVTHEGAPGAWAAAIEQAQQAARAALAEQNLPGLSIAVGAGGGVIWAEGFGWADLEQRAPVTPDTRFPIGTASTVLTSAAAGVLLERGKLNLDAEIQAYVPEFPKKQRPVPVIDAVEQHLLGAEAVAPAWPVTLRQLMGHMAGVKSDGGDEGPLFAEHCERPAEALRFFADSSLRFEPGTEFRYSRYGWILVSAAIEAAGGEPFFRFMRKEVFEPLGMDATVPDSATERVQDRASSYFPRFAADPRYGPDPMRELDLSCYAGSSAFVSTPSDLVRFATAIGSGALLKPATVQLLQTSQRLASGQETGYGLGWDLDTVTLASGATRMIGHNGDLLGGRVASLLTFPDTGLVVAVIANTSYADTHGIGVTIAQAFAERPASR